MSARTTYQLDTANPAHVVALGHLRTIVGNIVREPDELKYRRIREANPTLAAQLFAVPEARAALENLGFKRTGEGSDPRWIFLHSPDDAAVMAKLQEFLGRFSEGEPANLESVAPVASVAPALTPPPANSTGDDGTLEDRVQALDMSALTARVGFQMRLDALQANRASPDFIVACFPTGVTDIEMTRQAVAIARSLIDNIVMAPEDPKFRTLRFANTTLRRYFFGVPGPLELFVGVLGFTATRDGCVRDDSPSADELRIAHEILSRVETALRDADAREAAERREAARQLVAADRSRRGTTQGTPAFAPGTRVPIAQALQFLLGNTDK